MSIYTKFFYSIQTSTREFGSITLACSIHNKLTVPFPCVFNTLPKMRKELSNVLAIENLQSKQY